MTTKLTDDDIKEVNSIITTLQKHISNIQSYTEKKQFNEALKEIILSMKATECPLCKEKLAVLSSKIIEAKVSCKNDNSKCNLLIKEAVDKAENTKSEFVPIATEKKFIKDKETSIKDKKLPVFPLLPDPLHLFSRTKK